MSETGTEKLLTTKEVAERYGINDPRTVTRLAEQGKIPAPVAQRFGKGDRWRLADVEEHIRGLTKKAYEAA